MDRDNFDYVHYYRKVLTGLDCITVLLNDGWIFRLEFTTAGKFLVRLATVQERVRMSTDDDIQIRHLKKRSKIKSR